ncbi:MAG: hypothetical protein ACQERF_06085, partial [Actinomycetota bacterium]
PSCPVQRLCQAGLRDVTLPLAAPGVAAGFALVMLTAMKELPATLLLRPTGMDTLATRLWTETGVGAYAAAAPYAVALVVLAAVPTFLLSQFSADDGARVLAADRAPGGGPAVLSTNSIPGSPDPHSPDPLRRRAARPTHSPDHLPGHATSRTGEVVADRAGAVVGTSGGAR